MTQATPPPGQAGGRGALRTRRRAPARTHRSTAPAHAGSPAAVPLIGEQTPAENADHEHGQQSRVKRHRDDRHQQSDLHLPGVLRYQNDGQRDQHQGRPSGRRQTVTPPARPRCPGTARRTRLLLLTHRNRICLRTPETPLPAMPRFRHHPFSPRQSKEEPVRMLPRGKMGATHDVPRVLGVRLPRPRGVRNSTPTSGRPPPERTAHSPARPMSWRDSSRCTTVDPSPTRSSSAPRSRFSADTRRSSVLDHAARRHR